MCWGKALTEAPRPARCACVQALAGKMAADSGSFLAAYAAFIAASVAMMVLAHRRSP